jgi:hypothetical protein
MNLKAAWAQVFGVAAILVALAFAPSAAQAHAGHVYKGAAPIAVSVALPVLAMSVDTMSISTMSVLSDTTSHDQASHDHDAAELRTAPDVMPAAERAVCGQGCCSGAPCHGGTACTLGPEFSFLLPQDNGQSLPVWTVQGITGCDPEGIRKPPRTFA